jgi:hypothetical protein
VIVGCGLLTVGGHTGEAVQVGTTLALVPDLVHCHKPSPDSSTTWSGHGHSDSNHSDTPDPFAVGVFETMNDDAPTLATVVLAAMPGPTTYAPIAMNVVWLTLVIVWLLVDVVTVTANGAPVVYA